VGSIPNRGGEIVTGLLRVLATTSVSGLVGSGLLLAVAVADVGEATAAEPLRVEARPDRADTVRWADAAQARIAREALAAREGVAEWARFLSPEVTVDDRAWSGSIYHGRAAWREHLVRTYQLTLDEVHLQRLLVDPQGALVQQRLDYVAGLGAPAHVVQRREYGRDGVESLRTSVAIRDLQRRPGAGHGGFDELEQLARRYVATWSHGDADAVATLYAGGAELRDDVAGLALRGRRAITEAVTGSSTDPSAELVLLDLPGSDEPALYLDDRRPSAVSSLVLVHGSATRGGCPGTVAVQLDLLDGLIAGERRFHDLPSARRCLDDLPDGWWSSLPAAGPVDVRSGTRLVAGRPVALLNSSPELDRLLAWAFRRFDVAGLRPPSVGSITFASGSGRCTGIAGRVRSDADGAHVLLCLDPASACVGEDCATFTFHAQATALHELAHAWDSTWLDEPTRQAFLELRGLEDWRGRGVAWEERGVEQAAEILMWGLLEAARPLPRLHGPSCDELLAGYRLLTDGIPDHRGCAEQEAAT
jgi:hypothetical protein